MIRAHWWLNFKKSYIFFPAIYYTSWKSYIPGSYRVAAVVSGSLFSEGGNHSISQDNDNGDNK